jgi:hypothetical protein
MLQASGNRHGHTATRGFRNGEPVRARSLADWIQPSAARHRTRERSTGAAAPAVLHGFLALVGTKTIGKPLNRFLLLHLITKIKVKVIKLDTKININLQNIENFENELTRAELCRTRSVYENQYEI